MGMKEQSHELSHRLTELSPLSRLAIVLFSTGLALLIVGLVTQ